MKKSTHDMVSELSFSDKKGLSLRTLKFAEELGELSKYILPYEGAFATNHRFVDKEKILEELADTYLCHQSILYELGLSRDDLEQAVITKARKWADLQARERKLKKKSGKWNLPYEIHITVNASQSDVESFKTACASIGVKPILLDLHVEGKAPIKDLMTSSAFMGSNGGAYDEMLRISDGLAASGFEVLRKKIETIPWHPAAPSRTHEAYHMPPNCYFECHLAILCTEGVEDRLDAFLDGHPARKSRNVFKRYDDNSYTVMVTLRNYDCVYEAFVEDLEVLKSSLSREKFEVAKEIVEFSVYDTKVGHDLGWISLDGTS